MGTEIDLNCDGGESYGIFRIGNDEEMMKYVTSISVGCGFHGGDPHVMRQTVELAKEYGVADKYVDLANAFVEEIEKLLGKKLPLNVDGAIAALLCEMDFDPILANAFFMIARVPGLVAHIYEEKTRYKPMRKIHPTDVEYDGPEKE